MLRLKFIVIAIVSLHIDKKCSLKGTVLRLDLKVCSSVFDRILVGRLFQNFAASVLKLRSPYVAVCVLGTTIARSWRLNEVNAMDCTAVAYPQCSQGLYIYAIQSLEDMQQDLVFQPLLYRQPVKVGEHLCYVLSPGSPSTVSALAQMHQWGLAPSGAP